MLIYTGKKFRKKNVIWVCFETPVRRKVIRRYAENSRSYYLSIRKIFYGVFGDSEHICGCSELHTILCKIRTKAEGAWLKPDPAFGWVLPLLDDIEHDVKNHFEAP